MLLRPSCLLQVELHQRPWTLLARQLHRRRLVTHLSTCMDIESKITGRMQADHALYHVRGGFTTAQTLCGCVHELRVELHQRPWTLLEGEMHRCHLAMRNISASPLLVSTTGHH